MNVQSYLFVQILSVKEKKKKCIISRMYREIIVLYLIM